MKASNIKITCEYLPHPMGVERTPRISWQYEGPQQTAYRIVIGRSRGLTDLVYDSGAVNGDENLLIPCEFPLESMTRYYYRVFLQTGQEWSESEVSWFETGLLQPSDFNAKWITASGCESPLFQKSFRLDKIGDARLYICGLGFYEATLNGKRIGDHQMDPVWSDYQKRNFTKLLYPISDEFSYSCYYVIHDITPLLVEGENTLTVWLGNGWFNQHERNIEGILHYASPKLFCKLCVEGRDVLLSDETWEWSPSPITFNNVYFGEKYDARLEESLQWKPVQTVPPADTVMRAQLCPPDRVIRQILPKLIYECEGKKLYDMGVNSSGRVEIQTSAPAGSIITIRHAEEIRSDFTLDYQSSGGNEQIQTDVYISNGKADQVYSPRFCLHGFRYFEVEGEARVVGCNIIHSDVKPIGSFQTSDSMVNWIVEAYQNAQTSNLHSGVPSDCPHRERLGYTGDGQVTADTAMYFWDMHAFYTKWVRDIADCQCKKSGHVQHTAPFYGGGGGPGGWGCAMILVPWKMYLHYGDQQILEEYYENMVSWMDYLKSRSEDFLIVREEEGGWCLGDWCVEGRMSLTERFVNSCFYARCADIMSKISRLLEKTEAGDYYHGLYGFICDAIQRHFYHEEEGCFDQGKQGANAFAAQLGLHSEKSIQTLVEYYTEKPWFDTGIFGTPILFETLCELGFGDLAQQLVTAKGRAFDLWKSKGATTLHESWDSHDSHNHPMFGGIVGVMMRQYAGIRPDEDRPGFKHFWVKPLFVQGLDSVKAETLTPMGRVAVEWKREKGQISLTVQVPSNASATLILHDRKTTLYNGLHSFWLEG